MVKGKIVYKAADYERVGKSYKNEEIWKKWDGQCIIDCSWHAGRYKVDIMVGTKLMLNMMVYTNIMIGI